MPKNLTDNKIKSILDNLSSLREVAIAILNDPENQDYEYLATIINDRCTDIEIEICDEQC